MAIRRFFYVTQDALVVWNTFGQELAEEISFPSSDEGFRLFSSYLERSPNRRSQMVVDVIEEEFDTDAVPNVSRGDRNDLIERRLKRRFARTSYRQGVYLGGRRRASDVYNVVFTAITNYELIDPWIEIIERHKSPLVGITSVPLISGELLKEIKTPAENTMLISQHQGGRLRLVFMKSGQPISARLSRDLSTAEEGFAPALTSEIVQSRKYLERARRLSNDDVLDVYFVADKKTAQQAFTDDAQENFKPHIIDADETARRLGVSGALRPGHMEAIYLAHCRKRRPRLGYVLHGRTDYSKLLRIRHSAIAVAVAGAVACSIASGFLVSEMMMYRAQSQSIDAQVSRIEETFRRENDELEPLRADSYEMKLAVDTSDYILKNSLPGDWVMRELGRVMDDQPDMHIDQLSWELETQADPDAANPARSTGDRRLPVQVSPAVAVTARLSGEIHPYDGNLRNAFAKIDHLARSLQQNTAFDRVAVDQYPIDASPGAAVSGEFRREGDSQLANFSLTMSLRVDNETD